MADVEFKDLTAAEDISTNDILGGQRDLGGGLFVSRKFTFGAISLFVNKLFHYASDLLTSNKTVIGAINELNDCANIADKYDSTATYNIGDRVIYNGSLYECNSNSVTGTWDSTKWDSTTVDDLIYSANSLDSLSDVDIDSSTLAAGQTLVYNGTSRKFENGSASGSSHSYSTTEQAVGTWIDGKTIYERTIELSSSAVTTANQWTTISGVTLTNEDAILKTEVYLSADKSQKVGFGKNNNGDFQYFDTIQLSIDKITIQYTKTSV